MTVAAAERPSNRWAYAAIPLLLALSVGIQVVRDNGWKPYEPATAVLWLPSDSLVKRIALGFDNLVADSYWMRAVVYYGSERRDETDKNFDLLYPLLELTTTLDPRFLVAYRFGAIFLAEAYPSGPGRPDQAIALLKRGIDNDESRWEYMHDIAFVYYWWLQDYQAAAQWFDRAGDQKDAPTWLKPLAATTLAQGGNRESSRFLWKQILSTTDVNWLRQSAERRLLQLDVMDAIDRLNQLVDQFSARVGRPPATWGELIAAGALRGVPFDPTGEPLVIEASTGRVMLSPQSALWPLPTPPSQSAAPPR
jgi:tetratricopeptide (TPR) repeat protein